MRASIKGERGALHDVPLRLMRVFAAELPGARAQVDRITFSHSRRGWEVVKDLAPDLPLPPEAESLLINLSGVRVENISLDDFPFKSKPYRHQLDGLRQTAEFKRWALLMEMGTGKSKLSIDTAAYLWAKGEIELLLVVAPSGVNEKWVDQEIVNHLPDWVPRRAISTNTTNLLKSLDWLLEEPNFDGLLVLAINTECFSFAKQLDLLIKSVAPYDTLLVIDEATRFKNTDTSRWKAMLPLARNVKYCRILTGSPVTRHVDDLYGQFKLLMESVAGERTLTGFRARYCEMETTTKYNKVVGSRNVDELREWLHQHSFIRRKKDCLDLPEKVFVERTAPLSAEQRKHYNALRDELITYIDNVRIDADQVMARLTRLAQVCSGHLVNPETREVLPLDCKPRFDALRDIVAESDAKVVVWTRFVPEAERVAEVLPGFVLYTGRQSVEQRSKNLWALQHGDAPGLIGTMAAGGIGLDMTAASQVIYFSHTWNAEHRWQSEDRTHRIGQKLSVTYHDLIAPGTVDRAMRASNNRKLKVSDKLLNAEEAVEDLSRLDRQQLRLFVRDALGLEGEG